MTRLEINLLVQQMGIKSGDILNHVSDSVNVSLMCGGDKASWRLAH